MHTNAVAAALDSISLGPSVVVNNLTMIPLLLGAPDVAPGSTDSTTTHRTKNSSSIDSRSPVLSDSYVVLDDALHSGVVEITEVSEQGSVPNLKLVNRGAARVLIVDGEELLGAKQNRIVNLSILVAANSELTIPVSCVEAGRWRSRSRAFSSSPRTQYATGRAKRMANVSQSMMAHGLRISDQAEVWQDIAEKSSRLEAGSPTSAMEAIFERHGASIDSYVEGCRPVEGQVGALFAIDGKVIGFDLFDRSSTLAKLLPKLVRSVAVDAIDAAGSGSRESVIGTAAADSRMRAQAAQYLAVAAAAPHHATPALGLGEDLRLTAAQIAGAALVVDHHVVHLGAFAL